MEEALYKKIIRANKEKSDGKKTSKIDTYSRSSVILPIMVGLTIGVHNGKKFVPVDIVDDMVGHKLGEFSFTRVMRRHDKMIGGNDKRKS